MGKAEVYCDNETLKQFILDAKPSKNGLYLHETVMIFYAQIGKLKTPSPVFASIFYYQFGVLYPNLLLESLIDRGFIRVCAKEEIVQYAETSELRKLMALKNLKCKGRSSRRNMQDIIAENYTPKEIHGALGHLYHVPTTLGEEELQGKGDVLQSRYKGWGLSKGYANENYLRPDKITISEPGGQVQELHIDKSRGTFSLLSGKDLPMEIVSRSYQFPETSKLKVFVDGKILCEAIVDEIHFAKNVHKILLCQQREKGATDCVCYDYLAGLKLFKEKVPTRPNSMPEDQSQYSRMIDSMDDILEGDAINYFVSVNNPLAYYIVTESLKENVVVEKINNFLPGDDSLNYKISVKLNDSYARNIIMYMAINRMLVPPSVKGVPLNTIMDFLRKQSPHKAHTVLMENEIAPYEHEQGVMEEIKKRGSSEWEDVFKTFAEIYPKRVFLFNCLEYYCPEHKYSRDANWMIVKENYAHWHDQFKNMFTNLMIEGIVEPRWVNEFTLYLTALKYYPDAVYQYRDDWLGRQSLDIFIPSINTAIEYQGRQHYEPVDFFSGEEGFERQKQLDQQKRILCKQNEVRLIEWPYTLDVTAPNFTHVLEKTESATKD